MQRVICRCKECQNTIGKFINLWTKIASDGFSPIIESDDSLEIICHGNITRGWRGTLFEECQLQDIVCVKCSAFLGLKFLKTPVNHVLNKNQIMLKSLSVTLSDDKGKRVKRAIKRVLDYKEPSRVSTTNSTEPQVEDGNPRLRVPKVIDISPSENELASQGQHINQIDSNSPRVANALEKGANGASDYLTKLETTFEKCLLEVKGIFDDLASIKTEVNDPKDVQYQQTTSLDERLDSVSSELSQTRNEVTKSTNQVQQELTDLRAQVSDLQNQVNSLTSKATNSVSATDHANEVATPRAETADLSRLLSNTRSYNNTDRSLPSRELDILTSNMAKIGNRAAQVESLQMEFEIFKGRVERLEADQQTAETFMSPTSRKRTSSEAGLPETDRAVKLPVVSTRPSLSTHIPQLSTHHQNAPLETAGPEGAHLERSQSPQPSLSEGPSKEREPGRGERN